MHRACTEICAHFSLASLQSIIAVQEGRGFGFPINRNSCRYPAEDGGRWTWQQNLRTRSNNLQRRIWSRLEAKCLANFGWVKTEGPGGRVKIPGCCTCCDSKIVALHPLLVQVKYSTDARGTRLETILGSVVLQYREKFGT